MVELSATALRKLTVPELRKECTARSLATDGLKQALIDRLLAYTPAAEGADPTAMDTSDQLPAASAPVQSPDAPAASAPSPAATVVKRKAEDDSAASSDSAASAAKRPAFASASQPNMPVKQELDVTAVKVEPEEDEEKGKEQEEEEEEEQYTPLSHLAGLKRDAKGHIICPYLDTINRHLLDFDFEKVCSVSLATSNVYACLTCGKYFQGRGRNSIAYAHSLDTELNHHLFINLTTEEIYCLPDGYQIFDASLDDIKYNLHPQFRQADLARLDTNTAFIHALDGTDYLPGLVGLNNIKHTDWLNVIVQALNFIPSFRNFFIVDQVWDRSINPVAPSSAAAAAAPASASAAVAATASAATTAKSSLALAYGELLAKIWNPRSFKGHVSPHELLQAISALSGKKFTIGKFADCLPVLSWLLNELHRELGGTKKKPSIVTKTFQGEIKITTQIMPLEGGAAADGEDGPAAAAANEPTTTVETKPFLYLSLALPPAPLFKDATDKAIIPQVPLFDLLRKFDGTTVESTIDPATKREVRRTYTITRLPRYLILHYQRFALNNWFWEKNPTLVCFPLENLDLRPYVSGAALNPPGGFASEEAVRALSVGELKKKLRLRRIACDTVVEKEELVALLWNASKTPAAGAASVSTRYNLVSNIVHEGKPSKELAGSYKCHALHAASHTWYTTEDLHVATSETMAQQIALSEAYVQVYQLQKPE